MLTKNVEAKTVQPENTAVDVAKIKGQVSKLWSIPCSAQGMGRSACCPLRSMHVMSEDARSLRCLQRSVAEKKRRQNASSKTRKKSGQELHRVAGSHRVHEREATQAVPDHGAQTEVDEWGPRKKFGRESFQDVMVLEDKISEVENELYEASEETRKLTVERRKAEAEGVRVSDTVSFEIARRCVEPKALKVKLDLL